MSRFAQRIRSASSAAGTIARRAGDLIDSMGVVAHLAAARYTTDLVTPTEVVDACSYLGLEHVRTNLVRGSAITARDDLVAGGIKLHYTTLMRAGGSTVSIDERIQDITDNSNHFLASTDSVEPFNEYDGSGDGSWVSVLRAAQPYLFNQARAQLNGVAVLGPALIGNNMVTTAPQIQLANDGLPLSTYFDFGNLHSYFGGRQPESAYADNTQDFTPSVTPTNDITFDERLGLLATYISHQKPVIVTEMGYHNDPTSTTHKYTSLQAAGVYVPRAYLETFRIGIRRSYVYELLDEPTTSPSYEQHFGFFDMNGVAKPAAVYLHNLTSLLHDAGATALTFTPQRLAYRFSGSSGALTDLRSVLFQKTNVVFWLALWQGISVFDYTNGTDSTPFPASQSVTLALNQPATVTFFQDTEVDTVGGGTSLGLQTSCTLSVGPRVSLVRIAV